MPYEAVEVVLSKNIEDVGAASLRRNVLRFWRFLDALEPSFKEYAHRVSEPDVVRAQAAVQALMNGKKGALQSAFRETADRPVEFFRLCLGYARALDLAAFDGRPPTMLRPELVYRTEVDGETAWVLPLPVRSVSGALRRCHANVKCASRAFPHHRIIPENIAPGRKVVLNALNGSDGSVEGAAQVARLGGGLFSNLKLKLRQHDGGFIIDGIDCADANYQIDRLMQSAAGAFDIFAFPELTFTEDAEAVVKEFIASSIGSEKSGMPVLTICGSRHVAVGKGKYANEALLLDRRGEGLGRHRKMAIYTDKELGAEAIEPGDTFHCFISKFGIISVGICKDLCDASCQPHFFNLDTDLLVVISMGGEETMEGHKSAASQYCAHWKGRIFVIQQPVKPSGEFVGYVLKANAPGVDKIVSEKSKDQLVSWK